MISVGIKMDNAAHRDVKRLAAAMPLLLKQAYLQASLRVAGAFEKSQLSGRKSETSGLTRLHGGKTLAGTLMASAKAMPHEGAGVVAGRIGWLDHHAAMVATVQEFGATIRPVHAKWLRFKIPSAVKSAKTGKSRKKWTGWIFAKEVTIPPRLRFRQIMASAGIREIARKAATETVTAFIAKAVKRG